MFKKSKKLLLIGPRFNGTDKIGGIVVLFENLLDNLDSFGTEYSVVDSNSKNFDNRFHMYVGVLRNIFRFRSYDHISLHGTAKDYLFFAPAILIAKYLFNINYSLRKFAGSFDDYFYSQNYFFRSILAELLKKSDVNFFETKHLVDEFGKFNKNTFWFPNVRCRQNLVAKSYNGNDNFRVLFLSQVSKSKGVLDLIDAIKDSHDINVTIAGPIIDRDLTYLKKNSLERVHYDGIVDAKDVCTYMANFDCLVLPTYYEGEGYPGVIIEAFSVGLPVIASSWRQIPELVDNGGVLVSPKSSDGILDAILKVKNNHAAFQRLSAERFMVFEDNLNTSDYLERISINND